jgi:hypothetical protein
MDMKTFLKNSNDAEREQLAAMVGSSVNYFWQIAGGHKQPGPKLCKKLVEANPKFTLAELRPDIWEAPVKHTRQHKEERKTQ